MNRTDLIRMVLRCTARYAAANAVIKVDDSIAAGNISGLAGDLVLLSKLQIQVTIVCSEKKALLFADTNLPLVNYSAAMLDESDRLAVETAWNLQAAKIIYLIPYDGIFDGHHRVIRQMSVLEASELLGSHGTDGKPAITGNMREKLVCTINACSNGISRVHLINGNREGAILEEMFLDEGTGTLITADPASYQIIRPARDDDASAIAKLLAKSDVAQIAKEAFREKVGSFFVLTVDGMVVGCAAVEVADPDKAKIEFFALESEFDNPTTNELLLEEMIRRIGGSCKQIFVSPRNCFWFLLDPSLMRYGYHRSDSGAPGEILWIR